MLCCLGFEVEKVAAPFCGIRFDPAGSCQRHHPLAQGPTCQKWAPVRASAECHAHAVRACGAGIIRPACSRSVSRAPISQRMLLL